MLVVAAFALLATSCDKQPKAAKADKVEDAELSVGLKRTAVDSLWTAMISSNDRKIANTTYFLNLIGYTNITDTIEVHRIRLANDSLPQIRYNQLNLRALIDRYDSAENKVLQSVGELYNNQAELQKMMNAAQALEEIKAADDSVLIYRFMYDRVVEEYNQTLHENNKALKGNSQYKPLPLFRLNA
jgi:hypothetical protein